MSEDGPLPRRRRLGPSWEDLTALMAPEAKGGAAPWASGKGVSCAEELRSFAAWVGARRGEERCDAELVCALEAAAAALWPRCSVARVGAPPLARLACDAVELTVGGGGGGGVFDSEALCAALEKEHWVFAVDACATPHARSAAAVVLTDDDDDDDDAQGVPLPSVLFVEHNNGARAIVAVCPDARSYKAIDAKRGRAAGRLADLTEWRPAEALGRSAVPRLAQTLVRVADAGRAAGGGATWATLAAAAAEARSRRAAPFATEREKFRGDEASLELCDRALFVNEAGALRPRDDARCDDDEEWLCLAALCADRDVWPAALKKRTKATLAATAVARSRADVLDAKRGDLQTCALLRKKAKLNTYATGSYMDDDGSFQELDRRLVDQAKDLLKRDPDAAELPGAQQLLTNGDAAPSDAYSTALAKIKGSSSIVTKQAPPTKGHDPANKANRGGALLKLVKEARAPPPEGGPPPPRTEDEQSRAAALECARLELDAAAREAARPTNPSFFAPALPARALREARARQLLCTALRANFSKSRGVDFSHAAAQHAYAGLAWRFETAGANCAFPGAVSTTEPLGGRGALHAAAFDVADAAARASKLRPPALPGGAARLGSDAAAALLGGNASKAIALYTSALVAAPNAPALLVERSKAHSAAGLYFAALCDARRAVLQRPAWIDGLVQLSRCLGATGCALSAEALAEYCDLVGLGGEADVSGAAQDGCIDAQTARPPVPAGTFDDAKARGDAAFRAKQHVSAVEAYTDALRVAKFTGGGEAQKLAAIHSNRAAAAAGLGAHHDALLDGIAAAALAPQWVKGHVRVATALRALGEPRGAVEAYYHALRLQPGDVHLNAALCDTVTAMRAAA